MGIDAVFKARTSVPTTPEQFSTLSAALAERFPDRSVGRQFPHLTFDEFEPVQTLEIVTLHRYYGPGYERGHWPDLREVGDWLVDAVGERGEVRYGGDSAGEWEHLRPWDEVRSENDPHWETYGNKPYLDFMNRRGWPPPKEHTPMSLDWPR